ncbi:MAG: hypothetical protein ACRENB_03795, partial [Gemmatimonadales bacterium]
MRRRRIAVAAALLAAACSRTSAAPLARAVVDTLPGGIERVTSEAPTGWRDSTSGWRLEEAGRIQGEDGTESELIEPRSMAFDGEGRLYVADAKPPIIKVYDRTGRLVRTIGR